MFQTYKEWKFHPNAGYSGNIPYYGDCIIYYIRYSIYADYLIVAIVQMTINKDLCNALKTFNTQRIF